MGDLETVGVLNCHVLETVNCHTLETVQRVTNVARGEALGATTRATKPPTTRIRSYRWSPIKRNWQKP